MTTSGNPALATAADVVERIGVALGRILRESRPDVFDVPDEMQVQGLQPAGHDRYAAEHDAARVTLGRLTLPDEDGNYEYVADSDDEVLYALRQAVPELHSFENAQAGVTTSCPPRTRRARLRPARSTALVPLAVRAPDRGGA